MKNNFNKESNLYRFIKVNGLNDITKFNISNISVYTYLEKQQVDNLKHIKENLYELNGDYFIPSDYD